MNKKLFRKTRKVRKTKKPRKTRSIHKSKKGGDKYDIVNCCMCENIKNIANTLIPRVCLDEHGLKAHRICHTCWWNPEIGFAREGIVHTCPGCEKDLPFTAVRPTRKSPSNPNNKNKVIELDDDD